ncbi:MAG: nuclear transport factor 2 family protein [Pseudomonadales bacterium]|jgi:hypothetical protein|nr:nuclear transport factor 2 family protein [Pseudomonadales bacterium]|tara:strand:+ start:899 stop:1330 length:432 start_codon:yes stop_codon:yes gene_type:complete
MSTNEERNARRIQRAEDLFKAWSSGDADAPERFFKPTGTLYDVVAGELHDGWPEIRAFFAGGLAPGRNLELIPERYWVSDDGVALTWIMSSTITDDSLGPEIKGKRTRVMGMTSLDFDEDDLVIREVDYWTADDIPRSLGLKD